jgi:hypothetical protein
LTSNPNWLCWILLNPTADTNLRLRHSPLQNSEFWLDLLRRPSRKLLFSYLPTRLYLSHSSPTPNPRSPHVIVECSTTPRGPSIDDSLSLALPTRPTAYIGIFYLGFWLAPCVLRWPTKSQRPLSPTRSTGLRCTISMEVHCWHLALLSAMCHAQPQQIGQFGFEIQPHVWYFTMRNPIHMLHN